MRNNVEMIRFVGGKIPADARISMSVGIAEYPSNGLTAEYVAHCADIAMYSAKSGGKNRVVSAT